MSQGKSGGMGIGVELVLVFVIGAVIGVLWLFGKALLGFEGWKWALAAWGGLLLGGYWLFQLLTAPQPPPKQPAEDDFDD